MGHVMDAGRFDEYAQLVGENESGIDWRFYRSYAEYGNYYDVRACALGILVDLVHCFSMAAASRQGGVPSDATSFSAALDWLLSVLESDAEPRVRYLVVRLFCHEPPFARVLLGAPAPSKRGGHTAIDMVPTSPLDTDAVAERLCNLIKYEYT